MANNGSSPWARARDVLLNGMSRSAAGSAELPAAASHMEAAAPMPMLIRLAPAAAADDDSTESWEFESDSDSEDQPMVPPIGPITAVAPAPPIAVVAPAPPIAVVAPAPKAKAKARPRQRFSDALWVPGPRGDQPIQIKLGGNMVDKSDKIALHFERIRRGWLGIRFNKVTKKEKLSKDHMGQRMPLDWFAQLGLVQQKTDC